jgi:predicted Zn finger-like uncharacterized protein
VIIVCEKCGTRFQLDDGRVPVEGAKVRCSRCKHAFFVQPADVEGASDHEAAESLACATAAGATAEHSQVLGDEPHEEHTGAIGDEPGDERTQMLDWQAADASAHEPFATGPNEEESDWQFNEDPPRAEPEPDPVLLGTEPPLPPPAEDADPMSEFLETDAQSKPELDTTSLADLGSPEDWDLLGDAEPQEPAAASREVDAASQEVDPASREFEAAGEKSVAEEEPAVAAAAEPAEIAQPTPSAPPVAAGRELAAEPVPLQGRGASMPLRILAAGAWFAVAALLFLTARAGLVPPAPAPSPAGAAGDVAGLLADGVRGHVVENAVGGPLFVVSGRLRNPAAEPHPPGALLRVRLLDADGEPLSGALAIVAPAPPEEHLRLAAPEWLAADQREAGSVLARMPLAPGESVRFVAFFTELPSEARGFRFEVGEELSSEAFPPSSPLSSE